MAVYEALRATRLGRLKYDKDWLNSGKCQEVLALCSQFDRTLTLTTEEQRVIATSPKGHSSGSSGLGGGGGVEKGSQTVARSDGESSVSSKTVKTPTSAGSDSAKSYSTVDDKREDSLTGFELAIMQYEKESEQLLKATFEKRWKSLRNQWEEYEKRLQSPPLSPRLPSPLALAADLANNDLANEANEFHQVWDTARESAGHRSSLLPPLYETLPTSQHFEDDVENGLSDEAEEQRTPSPPSPAVELVETPEPDHATKRHMTVEDGNGHPVRETADGTRGVVTEASRTDGVSDRNTTAVPPPASRPVDPSVNSQAIPEKLPVPRVPDRPIETLQEAPAPAPAPSIPAQRNLPTETVTSDHGADSAVAHIRISPFDTSRFTATARLNEYKHLVAEFQNNREACEKAQERLAAGFGSRNADRVTKGIRQELSNLITTTINLVSKENMKEPLIRLGQLLNGDTVEFQMKNISVRKHPDAPEFAYELIAKTLVKQAENVASVQRDMAYPLALVAIGLWTKFPRVGSYLKAMVTSKCTYLVPYYPTRDQSDSDQDYLVKLGYIRDRSGEMEKQPLFLKRLIGVCRFWTAMMCTPAVSWNQLPTNFMLKSAVRHPLDFHIGWSFLVNIMQLNPRPDITATILFEFLEIASYFLKRAYGRQFEKLLWFMNTKYLPEILALSQPRAGSAAYARLKTFLDSGPRRFQVVEDYPRTWSR